MKKIKGLFKFVFQWSKDSDGHANLLKLLMIPDSVEDTKDDIMRNRFKKKEKDNDKKNDTDNSDDGLV